MEDGKLLIAWLNSPSIFKYFNCIGKESIGWLNFPIKIICVISLCKKLTDSLNQNGNFIFLI